MDGSAAEPVPGLQHRESLQAMPLARWLLLTVVLFSIHSYNKQLQKEAFPSLEQNPKQIIHRLII